MSDHIELEKIISKVKNASQTYSEYTQEQVDNIFKAAAIAANKVRISLAECAFEETKAGRIEDKVIKNHFACEYVYNKYKNTKTCGIIYRDKTNGITTIAEPLGVIAGIIPMTNPTSTVIFKSLLALKTRNGIIFSPHPRAKKCTVQTAKIMLNAAVEAGAPKNIIEVIENPSKDLTIQLMKNKNIDCILATGGSGMVNSAYSSGNPAIGVGSGNVPVIIDETADIKTAVSSVILSKTFDNGLICASEQAVIAVDKVYENVKSEFLFRGAYILSEEESEILKKSVFNENGLKPDFVGKSAVEIAKSAGLNIPEDRKLLISPRKELLIDDVYAYEKLAPVLSLYKAKNFRYALKISEQILSLGGKGHTSVLYSNEKNEKNVKKFCEKIKTVRILINTPSSIGGTGDFYNFVLPPSLTLGCGSWGKNSISANIGVEHLLNRKTVADRRENILWYKIPSEIYFKRGSVTSVLSELSGVNRVFVVTDNFLFNSGALNVVLKVLENKKLNYEILTEIKPEPDILTIYNALNAVKSYKPDCIIAFGGGSPLDAAKIIKLMYLFPDLSFEDISLRFMDIRKRICSIPQKNGKIKLIAIPTTSGTGSEVTPFSVITDEKTHIKYAIADYSLTPDVAIIDPDLTDKLPKNLTASSGIDALVHTIESYVSVMATEFSNSNALIAFKTIFKYLERAYKNGEKDLEAREEMHYASTIAGMAFANSFLGLCHSMAHKLGAMYNIPHGISNALLIRQIIKFNATDIPEKQCIFPQYKFPDVKEKYARLADELNLKGNSPDEKTDMLINSFTSLMEDINIPSSIADFGIKKDVFFKNLKKLSVSAFDDQCTVTNPVYPSFENIENIYKKAYFGEI